MGLAGRSSAMPVVITVTRGEGKSPARDEAASSPATVEWNGDGLGQRDWPSLTGGLLNKTGQHLSRVRRCPAVPSNTKAGKPVAGLLRWGPDMSGSPPVIPHRPLVPAVAPGELWLDAKKDDIIPDYPY